MSAHAKLSASGFKKWSTCTMSAALEQSFEDEDSEYSREGTCAHAVAETRLRNWLKQFGGGGPYDDESLVAGYGLWFTPEFSDHVDSFVEYVQRRVLAAHQEHGQEKVTVLLEQRLDFSRWVPAGFGTGDVVILVPGRVIVIDLKFGQGVRVQGRGNGQLRLYGLGAYDAFHLLYDFTEVEIVIHQPRLDNVSGDVIEVEGPLGLLSWAQELVVPRAEIAWEAIQGDRTRARFSPGEHCNTAFCKARYACAARARYMLELADQPQVLQEPDTLTVEQLETVYDKAQLAIKWSQDVKTYLLKSAARGAIELKRFELVEGRSVRVIRDQTEAASKLMDLGFSPADIYKPPELESLTRLEKLVGAKKLTEVLGDLLHKPAGAPTLAPRGSGKTPVEIVRPVGTASQAFGDLD